MRDRQDRRAHLDGEARGARLVARAAGDRYSRALRVEHDPEALREALAGLRRDLPHRILAGLAVDRDRRGEPERPAEERQRQQLLLGDVGERRQQTREEQRLPRRAVLAGDDLRRVADVLHADDAVADAADPARRPEVHRAPPRDEAVARQRRQPEEGDHQQRERRRHERLEQCERERAERRSHQPAGSGVMRRVPCRAPR